MVQQYRICILRYRTFFISLAEELLNCVCDVCIVSTDVKIKIYGPSYIFISNSQITVGQKNRCGEKKEYVPRYPSQFNNTI